MNIPRIQKELKDEEDNLLKYHLLIRSADKESLDRIVKHIKSIEYSESYIRYKLGLIN